MFPSLVPTAPFPQAKLSRVLVWFRRDLRLDDNPALTAALQAAEEVVSRTSEIHIAPWENLPL